MSLSVSDEVASIRALGGLRVRLRGARDAEEIGGHGGREEDESPRGPQCRSPRPVPLLLFARIFLFSIFGGFAPADFEV